MFRLRNTFTHLQMIGRSLMLPVSVLPVAGILLGIGSAKFSFFPDIFSKILEEVGKSVFDNIPLIFAIGVSLGFTNNNGVSALSAVVAYGIIVKTVSLVFPYILHTTEGEVITKYISDMGVLGGIIAGLISASMFNQFCHIKLPEYLGFFSGKRFIPIISGFTAILVGGILSIVWPSISIGIQKFSHWSAYQNPIAAFGIYGTVERLLIPVGLHHIWNVPFQMQVGEFINSTGQVFHGDIPRYMAGDPSAGKLSGGFLFKMYGLPAAAIAIWHTSFSKNRTKVKSMMISSALTAFLTGITEPIEFSFIFVSPILYVVHAILAGLSFPLCILMNMRNGISFSHGLIDFILLSGNGSRIWLFPVIGVMYFIIYYCTFRFFIIKFNLCTPGRSLKLDEIKITNKISSIVKALGGKKNIVSIDACITRLRVSVRNIDEVDQDTLKQIGALGVVVVGTGVQVVFGTQSERIKEEIDKYLCI